MQNLSTEQLYAIIQTMGLILLATLDEPGENFEATESHRHSRELRKAAVQELRRRNKWNPDIIFNNREA